MDVMIGADIGQRVDPTAIAVVELDWRGGTTIGRHDHYVVRYFQRLPIGTSYPDVVDELVRIRSAILARPIPEPAEVVGSIGPPGIDVLRPRPPSTPTVTLFCDATGVGQPVVDLLEAAGASPISCYFVHGERRTRTGREVRLGKAWLVSRLQALAQTQRVHLPKTAEAEATRAELLDYEIRVSDDGHDTYGAFKVGRHDDLVTALGLATQAPPAPVYVY